MIRTKFLEHMQLHMQYLFVETELDCNSKIESMAYFILSALDNCSGFEHELKLTSEFKGKEVVLNEDLLTEIFFQLNNKDFDYEREL
jgi:hypothetical protein